jgi:hypothetical protein
MQLEEYLLVNFFAESIDNIDLNSGGVSDISLPPDATVTTSERRSLRRRFQQAQVTSTEATLFEYTGSISARGDFNDVDQTHDTQLKALEDIEKLQSYLFDYFTSEIRRRLQVKNSTQVLAVLTEGQPTQSSNENLASMSLDDVKVQYNSDSAVKQQQQQQQQGEEKDVEEEENPAPPPNPAPNPAPEQQQEEEEEENGSIDEQQQEEEEEEVVEEEKNESINKQQQEEEEEVVEEEEKE